MLNRKHDEAFKSATRLWEDINTTVEWSVWRRTVSKGKCSEILITFGEEILLSAKFFVFLLHTQSAQPSLHDEVEAKHNIYIYMWPVLEGMSSVHVGPVVVKHVYDWKWKETRAIVLSYSTFNLKGKSARSCRFSKRVQCG